MATEARQEPKFPWDYDVPTTPFWSNIKYQIARGFLSCYSADEIESMDFESRADLSNDEKLEYLYSILQNTLKDEEAKAAPSSLDKKDYNKWQALNMGISTILYFQGRYEETEVIMRAMYNNGLDGTKNRSALHSLGGILEKLGRYEEAERSAKEILPWLQEHGTLGWDSPQALGSMRIIFRSVWKQGRYEEAEEWIKKCREMVERLGEGKFAKYQASESKQVDEDVAALEEWRSNHEGGMNK